MTKTGWKPSAIAMLLAAAALTLGSAAAAKHAAHRAGGTAAAPSTHIYQDWELTCPTQDKPKKDASCKLEEDVFDATTHDSLARITILRMKGNDVLDIVLPHNVLLDPGIGLDFDDATPALFNFETCDGVGCLVVIPFGGDLADKFEAAAHPRVLFAGLDGKPVGLPYSMLGFREGLEAYRLAERKLAAKH